MLLYASKDCTDSVILQKLLVQKLLKIVLRHDMTDALLMQQQA